MRRYHSIVITAGISVFHPANVYRNWTEQTEIFRFERTNPIAANEDSKGSIEQWRVACRNVSTRAANASPDRVSAEYSLLRALRAQQLLADRPQVVLIHTDTLGGQAAAILLERVITGAFDAHLQRQPVPDLDANDRATLSSSLGSFMEKIARALEAGERGSTCFAPIDGYKVMTALGYLAGAYMGFPTAYLHEDNQVLHEVPAIPIRIGQQTLAEGAPLIRRLRELEEAVNLDQLAACECAYIDEHPYLFDRIDELVDLNAFGRFIAGRDENKALLGDRVLLSTQAWRSIGDANHRAFALQQLRELRKRLRKPRDFVNELHHEAVYDSLAQSDFALYKDAVNGTWVLYAAYHWDERGPQLRINRLWFDHDRYQRDAKSGNGFFGEGGPWPPWDDAAS